MAKASQEDDERQAHTGVPFLSCCCGRDTIVNTSPRGRHYILAEIKLYVSFGL